jgi:hypothetical protein
MTCKDCKNFQPTQLKEINIKPYIGKGYTLDEIIKLSENDEWQPLWDCPYANDWCEEDDEINTLCNNKFEPKPI